MGELTVTASAKQQLLALSQTRLRQPGRRLRLATPPVWPGEEDFGIVIDDQQEDDLAIEHEGTVVLVVNPAVIEGAQRTVLDFKETPEGTRFTLDVH